MADSAGPRGQALDEDAHGGAMVERDAGTVDEAKTGGSAGYFRDEGSLAETHLADALAKALITPQLTDAPGQAGRELAEGMEIGRGVGHGNET
jgi:hypothetical protein